ncbi:MAG TPA: sterol desaturase family protein [Cytophagales bacterium]|nr:sterol desaturase family protein [Cytophagales bacterium]
MDFTFPVLDKVGTPILLAIFLLLFLLESKFELRKRNESRTKRIVRNVSIAVISFIFLKFLLIPVMVLLAAKAEEEKIGLLNLLELPVWIKFVLGFLALDYGNYLWHIINHKVPFLWRFHNIHHMDLDLDVTTAIRFHFGEVLLSVVSRGGVILLIGASPYLVLIYEIVFEAATNFHHSNLRLPLKFERLLNKLLVTPSMHGIHHSTKKLERDSNYSVVFSFWDRIHETIRIHIPQSELEIGVPSHRIFSEQTAVNLLLLPFKKQRPID